MSNDETKQPVGRKVNKYGDEIRMGVANIHRVQTSRGGMFVQLELEDEISGIRFLEVTFSLTAFASAMMGQSSQGVEFTLAGMDRLGMKRENKTELVPFDRTKYAGDDKEGSPRWFAAQKALAPFEVDGWVANMSDMFNWHRNRTPKKEELTPTGRKSRKAPDPNDKTADLPPGVESAQLVGFTRWVMPEDEDFVTVREKWLDVYCRNGLANTTGEE